MLPKDRIMLGLTLCYERGVALCGQDYQRAEAGGKTPASFLQVQDMCCHFDLTMRLGCVVCSGIRACTEGLYVRAWHLNWHVMSYWPREAALNEVQTCRSTRREHSLCTAMRQMIPGTLTWSTYLLLYQQNQISKRWNQMY